ncbi:MAG: general secretion pathway protein GspB [Pseudomonadota bacterium]
MSFILDALKKSESERQQQGQSAFAHVPVSDGARRPSAWLWALGLLLLINLVVLLGLLLRPSAPATVAAPVESTMPASTSVEPGFEDRVRSAIESQPAGGAPVAAVTEPVQATPSAEPLSLSPPTVTTASTGLGTQGELPDIDQLRATGELPIGDLRLDIHVYSSNPDDRFVFINMVKHREGSSTSDGLAVREITQDGVILNYRGRDFVLPRQ